VTLLYSDLEYSVKFYLEKDMVELGKIQKRKLKLFKGLKGVPAL